MSNEEVNVVEEVKAVEVDEVDEEVEDKARIPFLFTYCFMVSVIAWAVTLIIGKGCGLLTENYIAVLCSYVIWVLAAIMGGFSARKLVLLKPVKKQANKNERKPPIKNSEKFKKKEQQKIEKRKKIQKKKKELIQEDFDNIEQPLALRSGTVRGFLIISTVIMVISYLIFEMNIPLHFLIAFNIILLYYEIKPAEILPKQFVIDIPEKYATLDRMPKVSKFIDDMVDRMEQIQKDTNRLITYLDKTSNELSTKGEAFLEKVEERVDNFLEYANKFTVKGKTFFEQISLMLLLILIAVFSAMYIEASTDQFNAITISLAAFLAAVSIGFGVNISEIMGKKLKNKLKNAKDAIITSVEKIRDALVNFSTKKDDIITGITDALNKFKRTNILTFLPKDIVACISVNVMAYICGVSLFMPTLLLSEFLLIGIEFIIGYYFLTKK